MIVKTARMFCSLQVSLTFPEDKQMTNTELNLIQPMDDMKREMYIRARARIVPEECDFICWALLEELADLFNGVQRPGKFEFHGGVAIYGRETDGFLEEFFPEFFALHDGVFWPLELSEKSRPVGQTTPHDAWFDYLDRPRRLRLLDFLITHR